MKNNKLARKIPSFALALISMMAVKDVASAGFIVSTNAFANINDGTGGATYAYNGIGLGKGTFTAATVGNGGSYVGNGTIEPSGTLVSAFDEVRVDSRNGIAAYAFASADLASGTLKARGGGDYYGPSGQYGGSGLGYAYFADVLHFQIAGADANTITAIDFVFGMDGQMTAHTALGDSGGNVIGTLQVGPSGLTSIMKTQIGLSSNSGYSPVIVNDGVVVTGWAASSFHPNTPGLVNFTGTILLKGAAFDVPVLAILDASCGAGTDCDYSHTAKLKLTLPSNVTYASDSGAFLTVPGGSPVPEPGSSGLLVLGLLGMAIPGLRRRR